MENTVAVTLDMEGILRRESSRRWIAGCPTLDVFSQGRTRKEARDFLQEALELWVESCVERGTLDEALRQVGFARIGGPGAAGAETLLL